VAVLVYGLNNMIMLRVFEVCFSAVIEIITPGILREESIFLKNPFV